MKPEAFRDCVKPAQSARGYRADRSDWRHGYRLHTDRIAGTRSRSLAAEDIDFVAEDLGAVRPTVASDFLISHFHRPQHGYPKFMLQIVDPASRMRVDFFPDSHGALGRAPLVDVGGWPLRVLKADDLFEHKLALLSKASERSPIEGKHYEDAHRLAAICGTAVPPIARPQLTRTVSSNNVDEICPRCQATRDDAFPLASKRAIFDVLGYV